MDGFESGERGQEICLTKTTHPSQGPEQWVDHVRVFQLCACVKTSTAVGSRRLFESRVEFGPGRLLPNRDHTPGGHGGEGTAWRREAASSHSLRRSAWSVRGPAKKVCV